MKNETRLALGAIINLRERLENNDAPRSVALAQRTFQRFKLPSDYLSEIVVKERCEELEDILTKLRELQGAGMLDKKKFLEQCDRLFAVIG